MLKGALNYVYNCSKCKIFSCEYLTFQSINFSVSCREGDISNNYDFSKNFPNRLKKEFPSFFTIHQDFITLSEEDSLVAEIEFILKRKRVNIDHWDNAIQGYREIEHPHWNSSNTRILQKLRDHVFSDKPHIPYAHVLELYETGHIKPHIDSTRFCGDIISGLSLLSPALMRFQHDSGYYCDALIDRRSLYTMQGPARYEFTHEVLPNASAIFKGTKVNRGRRISVICRSEPDD